MRPRALAASLIALVAGAGTPWPPTSAAEGGPDRAAAAPSCAGGQTLVDGRCCWPGQMAGPGATCTGVPECPDGTLTVADVEKPTCVALPRPSRSARDDARCSRPRPRAYACDLGSYLRGPIRHDLTVEEIDANRARWRTAARAFCAERLEAATCRRTPGADATDARTVELWCCPKPPAREAPTREIGTFSGGAREASGNPSG